MNAARELEAGELVPHVRPDAQPGRSSPSAMRRDTVHGYAAAQTSETYPVVLSRLGNSP